MNHARLLVMTESIFIQTLKGQAHNRIPIWLMRQAGRYLPEYRDVRAQAGSFLDLCYNPKLASEVTLQPLHRFDLDAAIIFSDILVIPHALGQEVKFVEGEGPKLNPIKTLQDLADWNEKSFLSHLNPVFEAVSRTRGNLPKDKALIGFAGAPWTLACYMINGKGSRDYQNVRQYALANSQDFKNILDRLVQAIILYLIKKIEAGANALQIFDSWAGVLSAAEFEAYCIHPTKDIVAGIKAIYPDIPIIGFPRGTGYNYQSYITQTGINCVSCDQSIPLSQIQDFQKQVTVQGNLDNILLCQGGEPMRAQALKICQALSNKPFIFNLGHGVIKETNPDHVTDLIQTIRNFQKERLNHAA
jgi:uroporphyrinogen decarboxylase